MKVLNTATGQPRVVVTGLGVVTPLGLDVQTTWDAMIAGKSGVARITQFDPSRLTSPDIFCTGRLETKPTGNPRDHHLDR